MTLAIALLLIAGGFSVFSSLAYLYSITRRKSNSLTSVIFIWSVTSFWAIFGYFAYTSRDIWLQLIIQNISSGSFRQIVGVIAGIMVTIAFFPYIYSILIGRTRPERATWFIWSVVTLMGLATYYYSGGHDAIWVIVAYAVMTITVALFSIKRGVGGWSSFDKFIIFSCGFCLFLWWLIGNPVLALGITISIDALAALPTIRKTYYHPEQEDRLAWVISLSGNGLNLLAIERWDFAHAAYPVYSFIMIGIITELVLRRHKIHHHHHLEEKRM